MGENNKRTGQTKMGKRSREDVGGVRRPSRGPVHRDIWRVRDRSKGKGKIKKILGLSNKVKEDKHSETYGRLRGDSGRKTSLRGPMDYSIRLKLGFRVRNLDLRER